MNPSKTSLENALRKLAPVSLLGLFTACASPLHAQNRGEDEWYDPTDWFDGNNIESDDTYSYGNGSWDRYDTYDTWTHGYDNDYWDGYDWYDNVDDSGYDAVWVDVYTYRMPGYTSSGDALEPASRNTDMNNPRPRDRSSASASGEQSRSEGMRTVTLRGTIEGVRQMKLRNSAGSTQTATLAKVKLENGRSTVVNLGEQTSFRDIDLEEGDQIKAIGARGRIDGQPIFVARQLKVDGQTLFVNKAMRAGASGSGQRFIEGEGHDSSAGSWSGQNASRDRDRSQTRRDGESMSNDRSSRRDSASAQGSRLLSGEVSSVERVRGGGAERTLVRIHLEDGTSRVVDLGANASLRKLDVTVGDRISVRGQEKRVDNRDVIVASRIRVDGRVVDPRR